MRALPLLLVGCAAPAAPPVATPGAPAVCPSVVDARASLLETDRRASALGAGQGPAAFLTFAADDVVLLVPGEDLIRGVDAARAFFQQSPPAPAGWTPIRVDVSADGTLGTSFGWLDPTAPLDAAQSPVRQHGKYINMWRRSAGRWQLAAHLRTGLSAIEPAAPPASYPLLPDHSRRRCPAAASPDAELRALLDTDRAFAASSVAHGRAAAFHEYAAEDAVALPRTQIPYGRQAIFAIDTAETEPGESLEWTPLTGAVAPSGDLGYSVGTALYRGGGQRLSLKYLTVWRKGDGGAFRFIADAGNTRPTPALR